MIARLAALPFFVLMMGIGAAMMLVPAFHALEREDFATARIFLYGAVIGGVLTLLVGLATRGHAPRHVARSHLVTLFAAFGLLPLLLALPFQAAAGATLRDAWFEMVSAITSTGATLWDNPRDLNLSLHLWRAMVGWAGGFLAWVMAVAILAPMNLGGFEVEGAGRDRTGQGARAAIGPARDPSERLARHAARLFPVYTGLTAVLWLGLILAGDSATIALCHAMAVISTSGISPVGGLQWSAGGPAGEILVFLFFAFALSRATFSGPFGTRDTPPFWRDVEFRLGLAIVGATAAVIFLRHAVLAGRAGLGGAPDAFWGILFTAASFLTTTGFESRSWYGVSLWSGLGPPGIALLGLALIGGGVATTAGGVKLLRFYALLRHGQRETERLIHPASVGGSGAEARRIRRAGAGVAWVFLMLFALSILAIMLLLSLTGLQFETALLVTVSAITTTGPLVQVATDAPVSWDGLPDAALAIAAVAMVLGRLETLALVALLNPDFWRS